MILDIGCKKEAKFFNNNEITITRVIMSIFKIFGHCYRNENNLLPRI